MEVVDLADLRPDGVQVAGFVGDFARIGMNAWLIEALQRPEEVVGGLQADGFAWVGYHGVPGIGTTSGKAKTLGEVSFGMLEGDAESRITVLVSPLSYPEMVAICSTLEFTKQ